MKFNPSQILRSLIELRTPFEVAAMKPENFGQWLRAAWIVCTLKLNGDEWKASDETLMEGFRWLVAQHAGSTDELYDFVVTEILGEGYAVLPIIDLVRLLAGIGAPTIALDYMRKRIDENHTDDFADWQEEVAADNAAYMERKRLENAA